MAEKFEPSVSMSLCFLITTITGWLLFEFTLRRKFSVLSGHSATVFYSVFIVLVSLICWTFQHEKLETQITQSKQINLYEWEEIQVDGRVISSGKSNSGQLIATININETIFPGGEKWDQDYKIRVYSDSNPENRLIEGESIEATIWLYAFPKRRNPHEFDYGQWLHSQGISAHGELQKVISRKDERWFFSWGEIRSNVLENIDQLFEKEEASLAKALLLGYKDDLAPDAKQLFSRAGLSHIMAVSGLHVGFIVAPFWLLIPYLWGSRKGKWTGMILLTLLLLGYAGLTGFSASVSRASLMAWFLTYGRLFHKVRNSMNLTAVAAIILLLIDPNELFDPGFQLSFGAVFIILLVMPEAQRIIPQKYRFGWKGGLMTIIIVSFVVQLGLFPILMNYFGEFSLVGPISNTLVIPFLSIVVPVGLLVVLIHFIFPAISSVASIPIEYLLKWIHEVAIFTGSSDLSFIVIQEIPFLLFVSWMFGIFAVASIRIPKIRWKMVICLLASINGLILLSIINQSKPEKLEITFLDVGQGDAIHIKTPNGKQLLADVGRWSPGSNSGSRTILPYLQENGIKKLDAIFISHPHADHIGGIVDVLKKIAVDTVYQSKVDYDSNLYGFYREVANEKKIPVKFQKAGDIINVDPSIRLFILGPEEGQSLSNINNRSLVFKLVYGDTSVLFSGDAEKEQELELAERYGDFLKSDLYKVGHHGSNTSSSDPFLKFVEPEVSVASLAFRNRFDHPGSRAISSIHQYSQKQYYTSLTGAVVFESDGNSFRRIDWKKN